MSEIKVSVLGIDKLIDVIAQGIGGLAKPWMIRRVARAEAERVKILATAQSEIARQELLLRSGDSAENSGAQERGDHVDLELARTDRRIEQRVMYRETRRQHNLEAVALGAADAMKEEEGEVSTAPVDEDWVARFFEAAQEVSNQELQQIWSRLLAREVRRPGNVSLRTLEVLRNLTPEEARLFDDSRRYHCSTTTDDLFMPGVRAALRHLRTFQESGLVGGEVRWHSTNPEQEIWWRYQDFLLRMTAKAAKSSMGLPWTVSGFDLTSAGASIARAATAPLQPSWDLLQGLADQVAEHFDVEVVRAETRMKLGEFLAGRQ